jgi:hypothetical protein
VADLGERLVFSVVIYVSIIAYERHLFPANDIISCERVLRVLYVMHSQVQSCYV